MSDVLIIGGGLAGRSAALLLAARGLRVTVASSGWGHTAQFTGAWQWAQSPAWQAKPASEAGVDAAAWSTAAHVADVAAHVPSHPFARLGAEAACQGIEAAWASLLPALSAAGLALSGCNTTQPLSALPSAQGTLVAGAQASGGPSFKATLSAPAPAAAWVVLDLAAWGAPLSQRAIEGWHYDAARLRRHLPSLRHVRVPAPSEIPAWAVAQPLALARFLDSEAGAAALQVAAEPHVADAAGVLLPAVLGLTGAKRCRERLEGAWGVPVVEVLAGVPSVPGVRLMQALQLACAKAGVVEASRVTAVQTSDQRFVGATTAEGVLAARACVLATGRFLAGGLVWPSQGHCREALFHLPVRINGAPWIERSPLEVSHRRPEQAQAMLTAGVLTDAQLRACGPGSQAWENLWAIGSLLGGYADRDVPSSDGVALTTAYHASQSIVRSLQAHPGGGR